jgi:hypothetical protein
MPDEMLGVMGGPDTKEAIEILRQNKYNDNEIKKLLQKYNYSNNEINKLLINY